jgi:zinc protease
LYINGPVQAKNKQLSISNLFNEVKNLKNIPMNKRIFLIIVSACFAFMGYAQVDRSKVPVAGPAPKIQIGKYKSFTLKNGLQVFVVENNKFPIVSYSLTLDITPVLGGEAAGFTDMVGEMMRAGTKSRTKEQLDSEIDFIAANISAYSKGLSGSSLKKHSEKLLELMNDVLMNPAFPEAELDKLKKQTISGLAASKTDPNAILNNVVKKVVYGDKHPYGEIVTEESVGKINLDLIKNYYNTYFKPNVAYLVIVGDITEAEAKKQAQKYFGAWKKGKVPKHTYAMPSTPSGNKVAFVVKEDAVQSVVEIAYPVDLKPNSSDVIKATLMNEVLGGGIFSGRLNMNLREDKGYTYGAYSDLNSDMVVGSFSASSQVKAAITDSAVHEFLYEMKRMANEKVEAEHLQLSKNVSTGIFALRLENSQTIAQFALNIARYKLPLNYYETYLEKLNSVTADEIQAMAKKYIKPENAYIVVVGPKSEAEKLKRFAGDGQIHFYDNYGNPAVEVKTKKADEGISARMVIEKYLNAIGGVDAWNKLTNLSIEMSTTMSGMPLSINLFKQKPDKMASEVVMNGMVLQKQVLNGGKGIMVMQGQKRALEGEPLEQMVKQSAFLSETQYLGEGYTLKIEGIEPVDGKDAYKMSITSPSGKTTTEYYETTTGFKLKSISKENTQMGEMVVVATYGKYTGYEGIYYPAVMTQTAGPQEMKLEVIKVDTKTVIDASKFSLD